MQTIYAMRIGLALIVALTGFPADSSLGVEPRADGLHDLVIIDPGVHETGRPAVLLHEQGDGLSVEIPYTIHVHRYYYSGDKEYQGPIIQGGPTMVVANHPQTGQRLYVRATLPAGAPVIAYDKNAISYIYNDRRVCVTYSRSTPEVATVKYHSGRGIVRNALEATHHVTAAVGQAAHNSPTLTALKESTVEAGTFLNGTRQAADSLFAGMVDRAKALGSAIPGVTAMQGYAEDSAQRDYNSSVERFQRIEERDDLEFIRTNQ